MASKEEIKYLHMKKPSLFRYDFDFVITLNRYKLTWLWVVLINSCLQTSWESYELTCTLKKLRICQLNNRQLWQIIHNTEIDRYSLRLVIQLLRKVSLGSRQQWLGEGREALRVWITALAGKINTDISSGVRNVFRGSSWYSIIINS